MFTASNMLSRAITYYIPRGYKYEKTKIFVSGNKKRYYCADQKSYREEYLLSDHWKELKECKLTQTPLCENCGTQRYIEPHHVNYKNLYDVELSDLKTLCRKCHYEVDKTQRLERMSLFKKKKRKYKEKLQENKRKNNQLLQHIPHKFAKNYTFSPYHKELYDHMCKIERSKNIKIPTPQQTGIRLLSGYGEVATTSGITIFNTDVARQARQRIPNPYTVINLLI